MDNKSSPLVSIILPTYNRAGLIMETIESVQSQTYDNWELIIVDDGSEDNTVDIITSLNDRRIQIIEAGRIGIGGRIKNIGLENAKGGFIAFIDSDDLWDALKLEKQVNALLQHPEAGFCITGGYIFTTKGKPDYYFYKDKVGEKVGNFYEAIFRSEISAYTQALMLRKESLKKSGNFKEEKSFSDLEFIISLANQSNGVILYEPLFFRRIHDKNYISDTWEKSCREGIEIIKDNKMNLPNHIASNALFRAYIKWGEKYIQHGRTRKAVNCFLHALKHKPFSIVPFKKIGKAILR